MPSVMLFFLAVGCLKIQKQVRKKVRSAEELFARCVAWQAIKGLPDCPGRCEISYLPGFKSMETLLTPQTAHSEP